MFKSIFVVAAVCGLMAYPGGSDDLTGVKCLMNADAGAKKAVAVDYLGGQVYFCCGKCAAAFSADPDKHATKANHQLALTGQFKQQGCPFSGAKIKEGVTSDVGGVTVGFCCPNCKKKVDDAENLAAKADLVFSADAFKKAFVKKAGIQLDEAKCPMMPKRDVKEDQFVEYMGGKVFFCCKGCAGKFAKDPSKYTMVANQQLVQTGQFKQKGCPFSGAPVSDEATTEVNGVKIGFCCEDCLKKVNDAESNEAKAGLVFSADAFKKGFEKN